MVHGERQNGDLSFRRFILRSVLIFAIVGFVIALIQWIDCRQTVPALRLTTVLYEQSSDSFKIETQRVPWWSLRKLSKTVRFETLIHGDRVEGLYPAPRFRKRAVVAVPVDQDQIMPNYSFDADLPEGMWYAPAPYWQFPNSVDFEDGSWHLSRCRVSLKQMDTAQPIRMLQFFSAMNSDVGPGYNFYCREMGGIMANGLGQNTNTSLYEKLKRSVHRWLRAGR